MELSHPRTVLITGASGAIGRALALAYADTYPERVSGLILRGIFLATQEESERFFPYGTADYFAGPDSP